MGVEYRHFLVVDDPYWLPKPETLLRVHEVLSEWSLCPNPPQLYDLSEGHIRQIDGAITGIQPPEPGIAAVYPFQSGAEIAKILGASVYSEISDNERYLQEIVLIVGRDIRIHPTSEGIFCTVLEAPRLDAPLEPYPNLDYEGEYDNPYENASEFAHGLAWYDRAFPCPPEAILPKVKVSISSSENRHLEGGIFRGYWRAALILDCGKDLPAFIENECKLPNRVFMETISAAFGTPLLEVGEIY
ncbi:MAG: hypothetical protein ABI700_19730 [Chloroflexota bacterium]